MPVGLAASKASRAKLSEAFRDRPGATAELPSGRIDFATVFDFDDNQFEPDEEVRQSVVWDDDIIGINRIKGDVTFSTDLGIGTAREFEMDRERDGIRHRILIG
jgi:hypothetical protein